MARDAKKPRPSTNTQRKKPRTLSAADIALSVTLNSAAQQLTRSAHVLTHGDEGVSSAALLVAAAASAFTAGLSERCFMTHCRLFFQLAVKRLEEGPKRPPTKRRSRP